MKQARLVSAFLFALALLFGSAPRPVSAQQDASSEVAPKSGAKAFGLSLLVPGLGHRYVNNGRWGGAGSVFVAADVTLWFGLLTTIAQENHAVNGYTTLAALRSGNSLVGKNRAFELALGSYDSSQDYIDALLRSRQWDRLEGAQEPANQWEWASPADRERYVELRNDADSADRRTKALVGALVVNRLVSGITAALSSRKTRSYPQSSFSAQLGYSQYSQLPTAHLSLRF